VLFRPLGCSPAERFLALALLPGRKVHIIVIEASFVLVLLLLFCLDLLQHPWSKSTTLRLSLLDDENALAWVELGINLAEVHWSLL
jgi:hypothetical protein